MDNLLDLNDPSLSPDVRRLLRKFKNAGFDCAKQYKVPYEVFEQLGFSHADLHLLWDTVVPEIRDHRRRILRKGDGILSMIGATDIEMMWGFSFHLISTPGSDPGPQDSTPTEPFGQIIYVDENMIALQPFAKK